jgi:hypothetical protein
MSYENDIERIKQVFLINHHSQNIFFAAIEKGDLNKIKKMTNDIRYDEDYPVRFACLYGHLKIVEYFVSRGANIRSQNDAAIHWAALKGHLEVVKYLHEAGADIHGITIQLALQGGHLELVKYLCEAGASLSKYGEEALFCASKVGNLEMVKYLCKARIEVQKFNNRCVRIASFNNHFEVVKYICENGGDKYYASAKCRAYITFCEKIQNKIRERAQKKIYFWWIPICYDTRRECGKRMMQKNWEKTEALLLSCL